VRNLAEGFVPEHLRYVLTYAHRVRWSPPRPASLLFTVAVALQLGTPSAAPNATRAVGHALVTTLVALGALKPIFLALPLPHAWLVRSGPRACREPAQQFARRGTLNECPHSARRHDLCDRVGRSAA
jgi:hypothetical protein